MSVTVCVLRYVSGVEIARWNNQSTTPAIPWTSQGYKTTINSVVCYVKGTQTENPKYFPLPTSYYSSQTGVDIRGNFLAETGYEAVVGKNIESLELLPTVRISSDPTSTVKTVYLNNEVGYYHGLVIENSKYRFVEWRSGATVISTDNPLQRTLTGDLNYTAIYEQYKWTLATVSNNPTVGDAYVGASGTATSGLYENNSFETLRAVVKTAYLSTYKFKRWTLNGAEVSTEATIQVTNGEADKTYIAEFILINYTLNVTPQNASQGAVEVYLVGVKQITTTGLTVAGLSSVEVRTVPTFGYYLSAWHNGTSNVSTSLSYPFTMPEANLSLEARYAILPQALLVVTKKKGSGAQDPDDMGSATLYHTVDNYVATSPVGELTLQASMFTTKQYRLDPAPASALYQFDGWFKTVDGSDVEITDDSIFDVDGTSLYINVLDETQINVIARFSERTLCTIAPVSSDSSVYEANNAAEMAGCACAVTTLPPDNDVDSDGAHDSGDQWLSGQTITVEARQASGWELRSWIVQRLEDGLDPVTVYSKSKGDAGFGQTFSFPLLTDVQVIAVSAYTLPADQMQIQALLKSGQPLTSGTVEIHPCGDNYVEMENGSTANVDIGAVCELTAIPANGYKFLRWRVATEAGTIVSTVPTYSFTVTASAVYYAEFEATGFDSLVLFESGAGNKTLTWAGKTYLAPVPSCMSSARVYADSYPVLVSIGMSDNPSHPANVENVITSTAPSQNPFRLPMRRPRKSIVVEITATDTVSEVCVATSMEDLKNG
jgi:hypothetical protein